MSARFERLRRWLKAWWDARSRMPSGPLSTWMLVLLVVLAGCTTARRPPWIVEQPLYKALPEPAAAAKQTP
jgi:hypothetical protein